MAIMIILMYRTQIIMRLTMMRTCTGPLMRQGLIIMQCITIMLTTFNSIIKTCSIKQHLHNKRWLWHNQCEPPWDRGLTITTPELHKITKIKTYIIIMVNITFSLNTTEEDFKKIVKKGVSIICVHINMHLRKRNIMHTEIWDNCDY